MSYPTDLKYTKEHEWVRLDGGTGTVGITDFAQQQLGSLQQTRFLQTSRPAPRRGRGTSHKNRWLVMAVISDAWRSRPAMNCLATGDRLCGSSAS